MISHCKRAGHPYFNADGSINETNVYMAANGSPLCKACRRTGRPVGRPPLPSCDKHGQKNRRAYDGSLYCPDCQREARDTKELTLLKWDVAQLPAPTPEEIESDRLANERYAKLYG